MTKEEQLYKENRENGKPTIIPYCKGQGIIYSGTCKHCVWFSSVNKNHFESDKCMLRPCGNPYSVVCEDKDCIDCDITFCLWYGQEFPKTEKEKKLAYEKHKQNILDKNKS